MLKNILVYFHMMYILIWPKEIIIIYNIKINISNNKKMDNVGFGKQQFVGKVQGAVTDHYQMLKVRKNLLICKIEMNFENIGRIQFKSKL